MAEKKTATKPAPKAETKPEPTLRERIQVALDARAKAIAKGEPVARKSDYRLAVELCAGDGHDESLRDLAPFFIGNTHHRHFVNVWMRAEYILDLDRRDVLAPRNDHILASIA